MGIRKDKASGKWIASYGSGKTGSQVRRRFDSHTEAMAWFLENTKSNAVHSTTEESNELTLDDLVNAYLESRSFTTQKYRNSILYSSMKIQRTLGVKYVSQLTKPALEKFKRLGSGTPRTRNRRLVEMKSVFNFAMEEGLITNNPIKAVKPISYIKRQPRVLTPDECVELLRATKARNPNTWYPIVKTLLELGLRKAELVCLEWNDLDFTNSTVNIRDKPHIKLQGEPHYTKWGSSRLLPMSSSLKSLFQSLPRKGKTVFCTRSGGVRFNNFLKDFKRVISKAKIENKEEITPHTLRRTFISHLLQAGNQDIKMVSTLAGHKDLKTTQGYIGMIHGRDAQMKAVESLPNYEPKS